MKLRHLLFGLLAGVAFVACTNDDDPAGASPVNGGNEVATAPKYMSVNFVTSDGATTRAEDQGIPAESAITEAAFLFFKGTSQVADPFVIKKGVDYDAVTETGYEGYPKKWDDTTEAVVVLENPTDIPTSMVVLVNSGKTKDELIGKTVADLQGENFAADYFTGKATEGKFVMANAVYNEGNANVIGAPVSAENVKDTPADAEDKPVDVYVERVLAKVNVTSSVKDNTVVGTTGYDTNKKNITVKFNGWALVYENGKSYLIKNLGTDYANVLPAAFSWNDAGNKRSYWADAYYPTNYTPKTGPKHTDITNKLDANTVLYTQENTKQYTPDAWEDGRATNPTAVIVAATLSLQDAPDGEDLYKLGSAVLTKGDVEITLKNSDTAKQFYKEDGTPVTEYTMAVDKKAQDKSLEDYQAKVYLKLETEGDVYTEVNGQLVKFEGDVNAELKKVALIVELFTGGATYYYVPIKQHVKTAATGDKDVYGIVRNNFYKISITGVSGLGTAVPDPAQPITPDKPEDSNYYIAAKILVQNWNLVEQNNVVLGE